MFTLEILVRRWLVCCSHRARFPSVCLDWPDHFLHSKFRDIALDSFLFICFHSGVITLGPLIIGKTGRWCTQAAVSLSDQNLMIQEGKHIPECYESGPKLVKLCLQMVVINLRMAVDKQLRRFFLIKLPLPSGIDRSAYRRCARSPPFIKCHGTSRSLSSPFGPNHVDVDEPKERGREGKSSP